MTDGLNKMNITKSLLLITLAFILSILDTSFFSFIPILGTTIISSYAAIINFSIAEKINDFLIFTIAVIFFFSSFSSLPVWLIVMVFLIFPSIMFYVKKTYFPEPSVISSFAFFVSGTLLFALTSLIYTNGWNREGTIASLYFIAINSAFGVLIYYLLRNIKRKITRKEIKF